MELIIDDIAYPIRDLTLEQYEIASQSHKLGDAQIVSLFTGVEVSKIKKQKFTNIKFIANYLRSEIITNNNTEELQLTYTFNGVHYGLIKPSEFSFEEWINLEVFMAQKPLNLPLLAAHLYRPLKNTKQGAERELVDYDLGECQERANEFKKFPLNVFISALFFLTIFAQKLMENTP